MQYLMMDLHQRFIGALQQDTPLAIGDILRVGDAKRYKVVRVDAIRNAPNKPVKSVTVIPIVSAKAS
ncbi:MAG: hypothetical protein ACK4QL_01720 [Pseudanabaenaceae cyanobacterium]